MFALNNKENFQEIWKETKNKLILSLNLLEIGNFNTSIQMMNKISKENFKKLDIFLENNTKKLFDLKGPKSWLSKYSFSIIFGIFVCFIVIYLFYKSPKLQNKKFV